MSTACFAGAEAMLGRTLTQEEKKRITDTVARVITKGMGQDALDRAVARAIDLHLDEVLSDALTRKRNVYLNKKSTDAEDAWIQANFSHDRGRGIKAMLVGYHGLEAGTRNSLDMGQKSLNDSWAGTLATDIDRIGPGTRAKLRNGAHDTEITEIMMKLDKGRSLVGADPTMVQVAKVFQAHYEKMRRRANDAGANISKRDGYAGAQSHDMIKIRAAGQDKWKEYMRSDDGLDFQDMFGAISTREIDEWLDMMYARFESGEHVKFEEASTGGLAGFQNIGRSMSHQRSLVFKTAAGETKYRQKYGKGTLLDNIFQQTMTAAQNVAIMERLGPNATNNLAEIIERSRKAVDLEHNGAAKTKLKNDIDYINDQLWPTVNGASQIPGRAMMAAYGSLARTILSMNKLGGAVLSSISDVAYGAAGLRSQGMPMFKGMANQIEGIFRTLDDIEVKEAMARMGVAIDGYIGQYASRLAPEDVVSGMTTKANTIYYNLNLLTPYTDRQTVAMAMATSAGLATHVGSALADVSPHWQKILKSYGIDDVKWDAIRSTPLFGARGKQILTAEAMLGLPDRTIDTILVSQGRAITKRNRLDARNGLETTMRTLFQDQVSQGVIKPGARTRAALLRGNRPGTIEGELWRFFAQFKMFPAAVLQGPIARAFKTHTTTRGQLTDFANLILSTATFGYAAMVMKDLFKGQKPRTPDDWGSFGSLLMAALAQGGGAGLYGDFLFGEMKNRFGRGALDSFLGPGFSALNDLTDIATGLKNLDPVAVRAFNFLMNNVVPGYSLFYTKAALDYALIYGIKEQLNPGYLRRMERYMKKNNDQEHFYPPSKHAWGR